MANAAYYRAWRAAHPEYRARQNRLRAERRRRQGRGDRSAEYARRRSRATPPMPPLHDRHDLLEQARRIVGARAYLPPSARERADGRVTCPLFEDAA